MSTKPSAKTESKEEAVPVEEVSLEAYLRGVDASATLKGMFTHYTRKTEGPETASKKAFDAAFEAFKDLPATQLP
jgi:hypothetical protein